MNAVFCCPRCNTALGTPDDPRPEPLPPCPRCGWGAAARPGFAPDVGLLLTALVFLSLGVAAGGLTGHSLLLVPVALLVFGPFAAVGIARTFNRGWFVINLAYALGLAGGLLGLNDGQTLSSGGWKFPVLVVVGSLLLGWFVGWLKHTD